MNTKKIEVSNNNMGEIDDRGEFDFENNFITCKCEKPELYPPNLSDGGYSWCKICKLPLGSS